MRWNAEPHFVPKILATPPPGVPDHRRGEGEIEVVQGSDFNAACSLANGQDASGGLFIAGYSPGAPAGAQSKRVEQRRCTQNGASCCSWPRPRAPPRPAQRGSSRLFNRGEKSVDVEVQHGAINHFNPAKWKISVLCIYSKRGVKLGVLNKSLCSTTISADCRHPVSPS